MTIFNTIILVIVAVIPVTMLGYNLSNWILILLGVIFLCKNRPKSINKSFIIMTLSLVICSIVSIIINGMKIDQIGSMSFYVIIPIYYLVFKAMSENIKNKDINITLIISAVVALGYIFYVGVYYGARVYGNLGYANSYALLMLMFININCRYNTEKFSEILNIIYIITILFTGSRTTLILLLINIVYIEFRRREMVLSETFIASLIVFTLIENIPIVGITILPVIFYLFLEFKGFKNKKISWVIMLLIIASFTIVSKINTFQRIENISISNGSFQERLLTFEDVIRNLNFVGHGINTFEYKQFKIQSGFYDIKYIHNSILHTSFELGIVGGIALIVIIVYGSIILLKKRKIDELAVLLIVFIHSLLDFDFAYSSIIILLLFVVICRNKNVEVKEDTKVRYKIILCCMIILSCIIIFNESILRTSYLAIMYEKFNISQIVTNINLFNDWRIYQSRSDSFIKDINGNELERKKLLIAKDALINGLNANKENIMLKWNLAYVYEKMNDSRAKGLRLELVEDEKYNFESYKEAYKYSNEDKSVYFKLNEIFKNAYIGRSFRAKYIKNQIKDSLEETLKM
ncbi:O-antigen ligase family protein [Inconstantimicrobium mannanitabidum]|uniref:Uncharacterized protein n=1 Tax=Inconstantimicrobium mannanitabidum TaxID=1604901 RepID=A0ACB5RH55_9CLOT|nr:O-antigen ligase family protein [Clostridium sp. TW13]GKX68379.1 hypothetical protein rsdtw13_36370 [Clostridium sp. TW13]